MKRFSRNANVKKRAPKKHVEKNPFLVEQAGHPPKYS
jgi:hypothetical protein